VNPLGAGNQQPATSNQQPATSNQQPATSNQQPATSNQQPGGGGLIKGRDFFALYCILVE
jgi:hypothetical protein